MSRLAQEKDPEVLHRAIELLQNHNRALTNKLEELLAELAKARGDSTYQQLRLQALERQLAKLTKQVFGPSSEQRTTPQLRRRPPRDGGSVRGARRGRRRPAAVRHQAPQAQEVRVSLRELHRHRAIYVAVSKYCDHLPLERQVRMMAREGLVVTSQTLWDQIERLAWVVESVMPRLRSHVLGHGVVGADETTWESFDKKPGQGKSWYVWMLRVETAVYYAIRDGRSFKTAEALLATFAGVLMCDGYAAYKSLSGACPRVVLAHCWAHVRRELVEIERGRPSARPHRAVGAAAVRVAARYAARTARSLRR